MGGLTRRIQRARWKEGSSSFRNNKVNGKKVKNWPWQQWRKMAKGKPVTIEVPLPKPADDAPSGGSTSAQSEA